MKFYLAKITIICIWFFLLSSMEQQQDNLPYNLEDICKNIQKCACGKRFVRYNDMKIHISQHYNFDGLGQAFYWCPACNFETTSINMLLIHFPYHTKESITLCSKCLSKIPDKYQHSRLHEKYEKEFAYLTQINPRFKRNDSGHLVCNTCGSAYGDLGYFLQHIRMHFEDGDIEDLIELAKDKTNITVINITPEKIAQLNPLPLPQPYISEQDIKIITMRNNYFKAKEELVKLGKALKHAQEKNK